MRTENKSRMPCGRCGCGTYSEAAVMTPQARYLMATPSDARAFIACKSDPTLPCEGALDFCRMIDKPEGRAGVERIWLEWEAA